MPSKEYRSLRDKYTNFTWSKPVGYDFQEVDDEIENYKRTIADIGELLQKKDNIILALKTENNRLIDEVTNTRMQMESLVIPSISEKDSLDILSNVNSDFDISEDEIQEQLTDIPDDEVIDIDKEVKERKPKHFPKINIIQ